MDSEDDLFRPPALRPYKSGGALLSVPASALEVTLSILQAAGQRECGLFWYGPKDAEGNGRVAYVAAPRQEMTRGNFHVTTEALTFSMQLLVQGAWGGMPAYLNEISPTHVRGTFPGTVYQIGGLISSINLPLQLAITDRTGGNFGIALTGVAVCSALAIAILIFFGPDTRSQRDQGLKKADGIASP